MSVRSIGPSAWASIASILMSIDLRVQGQGIGNPVIDLDQLEIDYSVFGVQLIDLASGNNTVSLPISASNVKATAMIVAPPRGNTTAYTIRLAGETGVPENPNFPFVIKSFSTTAPPTSVQINAAAAISGVTIVWL